MNTYYPFSGSFLGLFPGSARIWIVMISIFITGCNQQLVKESQTTDSTSTIEQVVAKSASINVNGLAKELPVILFTAGKTRLSHVARKQIREIAQLVNHPDIIDQVITIDGHSDTLGDAHRNMVLSRKRAESVSRELVINGVRPSRLIINALGESQPLVTEFSDNGQLDPQALSLNRRVEIFLGQTDLTDDQL